MNILISACLLGAPCRYDGKAPLLAQHGIRGYNETSVAGLFRALE